MAAKVKKEKKAWIYENGEKRVFEYTPSGKLSKFGEWMEKNPSLGLEYVNMRAIMR